MASISSSMPARGRMVAVQLVERVADRRAGASRPASGSCRRRRPSGRPRRASQSTPAELARPTLRRSGLRSERLARWRRQEALGHAHRAERPRDRSLEAPGPHHARHLDAAAAQVEHVARRARVVRVDRAEVAVPGLLLGREHRARRAPRRPRGPRAPPRGWRASRSGAGGDDGHVVDARTASQKARVEAGRVGGALEGVGAQARPARRRADSRTAWRISSTSWNEPPGR